jgi:urease accessory protein
VRAFPLADGGALVHLHNISGGILGGDHLQLATHVAPGAYAQLTTTSATRVYRCRPAMPAAQQLQTIHVAENGLLEYVPDQLIPFAGSRYRQHTTIHLEQGAGLFYWETVAPGRVASDELFQYDLLQINCDITAQDRPIVLEHTTLEPQRRALTSPARLGPYHYFSSFYICKVGLDARYWLELESNLQEIAQQRTQPGTTVWGVSTLVQHGLLVRALSIHGRDITSGLLDFWNAASRALYGRDAQPPRKIY